MECSEREAEAPFTVTNNCSVIKAKMDPREVTLRIKKATVVLTPGTDLVCLTVDLPTAFPEMGYETVVSINARYNYGAEWCEKVFGIIPDVVGRSNRP